MDEEYFVSLSDEYFNQFHTKIKCAKLFEPVTNTYVSKYNIVIRKILVKYIGLLQASWETIRDDTCSGSLTIKQLVIIAGSSESQPNVVMNHLYEDLVHKVPYDTFLSCIPLSMSEIYLEWATMNKTEEHSRAQQAVDYLQTILILIIFSYGCHVILEHPVTTHLTSLLSFLQQEYVQFHAITMVTIPQTPPQPQPQPEINIEEIVAFNDLFVRIDTSQLPQKQILSPWYMHWDMLVDVIFQRFVISTNTETEEDRVEEKEEDGKKQHNNPSHSMQSTFEYNDYRIETFDEIECRLQGRERKMSSSHAHDRKEQLKRNEGEYPTIPSDYYSAFLPSKHRNTHTITATSSSSSTAAVTEERIDSLMIIPSPYTAPQRQQHGLIDAEGLATQFEDENEEEDREEDEDSDILDYEYSDEELNHEENEEDEEEDASKYHRASHDTLPWYENTTTTTTHHQHHHHHTTMPTFMTDTISVSSSTQTPSEHYISSSHDYQHPIRATATTSTNTSIFTATIEEEEEVDEEHTNTTSTMSSLFIITASSQGHHSNKHNSHNNNTGSHDARNHDEAGSLSQERKSTPSRRRRVGGQEDSVTYRGTIDHYVSTTTLSSVTITSPMATTTMDGIDDEELAFFQEDVDEDDGSLMIMKSHSSKPVSEETVLSVAKSKRVPQTKQKEKDDRSLVSILVTLQQKPPQYGCKLCRLDKLPYHPQCHKQPHQS